MSIAVKHLSKAIKLELYPLELEEFNGDKEAYLLSEFQNALSENYIAQFGRDRKTIVIYEKETVYAQWQSRIPRSFGYFLHGESKTGSVLFHIPKTFLASRSTQHIIVQIKKIKPTAICNEGAVSKVIELNEATGKQHLWIWNKETNQGEIYEYHKWQVVGLRYRSER